MAGGFDRNLQFGPFELSIGERLLLRERVVLPLGSRALDLLIYLAERPGEVIAKQELIDHVWSDVTVEEGSLRVHVAAIRKALGDGQFGNRYIANIKGRGYSFVGTVVPLAGSTESGNDKFRHQGRLPVRPLMMIGRETVISKVSDKLQDERFVTLLGPGGIGKTTIALAVGRAAAEEFGGKVCFVDLESLTDSRHVAGAVATSLGLALKSKDPGLELVDLVRSRKLLIILDSCEHVIEAVASLAEQLYRQTEEIHVLTTSRELLKVEGEHCYRVLPLDYPPDGSVQTANAVLRYPAVQLFVRRVAARAGSVVLTDAEAPFVAEMCRKLDGMPLAIELAAGQVGVLGVGTGEIFDAIAGLVEKSLIATRIDETQAQYRLLDTTRAYAREKLEEHAELDVISGRHAIYVAEFLESQRELMLALPRARRTAAYSDQLSNIRTALEWSFGPHGDDEIATRLAAASAPVFLELSLLIECQAWSERAIARLGTRNQNSRRAMEIYASLPLALMHTEGNDQHVRASFSRALEIATNQGDLAYELRLLSGLFVYSHLTMDIRGATDIAARSKKLALKKRDPDDMALAESMLAASNHLLGNHIIAQQHCESGLRSSGSGPRFRDGQHLFHYTSFLLVGMARSLLYRGLLDRSLEYAKLAIEEAEKSGHPATFCRSLALIIPVFLTMADTRRSDQYIAELSDLSAAHSLKPYCAIATGLRGQWLLLQNNLLDAISLLKRALEELHAQRQEMLNMDFACDLAAALMKVGEHEQALRLVLNAIDVQQRVGKFLHMPALFRMKGLILASRSAEEEAEAENALLLSIDWAKRQSAVLFELKAATDLAELLLRKRRTPEAYRHISAALNGRPDEMMSPVHMRARQVLRRFQSSAKAVG